MPPNLHSWEQFITPAELNAALGRHELAGRDVVGIAPGVKPPQLLRMLRQLRKGRMSYGEFGHRAQFVVTGDTRVSYAGFATKAA
jgi:2-polyprenyl-6-hydroxyphenyl methylase / 3-demethylubiquinone-9 3-methyltransferase